MISESKNRSSKGLLDGLLLSEITGIRLRLFIVSCNTKNNPLQTSGFPINFVCICLYAEKHHFICRDTPFYIHRQTFYTQRHTIYMHRHTMYIHTMYLNVHTMCIHTMYIHNMYVNVYTHKVYTHKVYTNTSAAA